METKSMLLVKLKVATEVKSTHSVRMGRTKRSCLLAQTNFALSFPEPEGTTWVESDITGILGQRTIQFNFLLYTWPASQSQV
ncbi:hypothetical protein KEM48_007498 [Puccinia striiformis f. sp. tritici PST-130]|nr:hypothetical protein KEM48_007498 [Puccinia striiformis f. sp. tritici PST-130]